MRQGRPTLVRFVVVSSYSPGEFELAASDESWHSRVLVSERSFGCPVHIQCVSDRFRPRFVGTKAMLWGNSLE